MRKWSFSSQVIIEAIMGGGGVDIQVIIPFVKLSQTICKFAYRRLTDTETASKQSFKCFCFLYGQLIHSTRFKEAKFEYNFLTKQNKMKRSSFVPTNGYKVILL